MADHLAPKSQAWYRNVAKTTVANPLTLLKSDRDRLRQIPNLGEMYVFAYDAKHKATLPYWDMFPIVIPFDAVRTAGSGKGIRAKNGPSFMGLNFHYLPFRERAWLMNGLYKNLTNNAMDETTRIKISYRLLKSASQLRAFRPCVKQYLFSQMRSRFFYIEPKEWDCAIFLPIEKFVSQGKPINRRTVHNESKKQI